jgi:hypothetical protein
MSSDSTQGGFSRDEEGSGEQAEPGRVSDAELVVDSDEMVLRDGVIGSGYELDEPTATESLTQTARRRTLRYLAWGILSIFFVLTGGVIIVGLVGGEDTSEAGPASAPRFVVTSSTVGRTTTTASGKTATTTERQYPHVSTFDLRGADGYTATAVLQRGDFVKAANAEPLPPVCPPGQIAELVMPFRIILTNTTPGFPAEPSVALHLTTGSSVTPDLTDLGLRAITQYSAGPDCEEFDGRSSGVSLTSTEPLRSGNKVEAEGWFLVSNFYTPAAPEGDREKLRKVLITVSATPGTRFGVAGATNAQWLEGIVGHVGVLPLDPTSDVKVPCVFGCFR